LWAGGPATPSPDEKKDVVWFVRRDDRPLTAFADIRTKCGPGTKLKKAMPVSLTTDEERDDGSERPRDGAKALQRRITHLRNSARCRHAKRDGTSAGQPSLISRIENLIRPSLTPKKVGHICFRIGRKNETVTFNHGVEGSSPSALTKKIKVRFSNGV
jgi:hypothetical protein